MVMNLAKQNIGKFKDEKCFVFFYYRIIIMYSFSQKTAPVFLFACVHEGAVVKLFWSGVTIQNRELWITSRS